MGDINEVLSELVRDIIRKECREQLDTAFRAGNHVSLAALDEKIDKVAQDVDALTQRVHSVNHAQALHEALGKTDMRDTPTAWSSITGADASTYEVKVLSGYECLFDVLVAALEQAQSGKGAERHANNLPFDRQPMQSVADATGSIDGILFQMMKKARESSGMPLDRAVRELLGSIVYAAGAVIWRQRHADNEQS